ncbi:MAG: site-specific DNA-methyltransferase [Isosphaeraceae bacterium]
MEQGGRPSKARKSSRLSEGTSVRPLDYQLVYEGKQSEHGILAGPRSSSRKCLSVTIDKGATPPNRLYLGDNLGVLRALCDDPAVAGHVSLVYIDPPFATGASFESRDAEKAYDDGEMGAKFLEFLRQRLILLRELLSAQGSIYIHLDSKMAFPVKITMDEIFGPINFRNWITRKKSNRKNSTRKQYGNISDFILFYSKTNDYTFNRPCEEWTEDWIKQEYQCVDEKGRRYKKVPVHAPGVRNGETGKHWKGKLPPPGKHWQFQPATLDEMDARGEIYWSPTGNPRRKLYHDQSEGIPVQDIWMDFRDAHNQNIDVTGYPTEKNIDMLRRIVGASSNPGDLVLDCFMGSGTTLIAAEEMERRWIGVDSGITAMETTLKRLANGSEPMGDFVNGKKGRLVKSPTLFSTGVLASGFDLFLADDTAGKAVKNQMLNRWGELFATSPTSTLA